MRTFTRVIFIGLAVLILPAHADMFKPSPSALAVQEAVEELKIQVQQIHARVALQMHASQEAERAKNSLAADVRAHVEAVESGKPAPRVIGILNGKTLYAEGDEYHVQ